MFGQFSEQMKKSSQPVNELLAANVKAIETVTKQQTQFFSGLVEDSVKLMQTVAQQTEVQGVLAAQSVYAESVRERLTSNSKVTYNTVSSVSKQYTDALQSGIAAATEVAKEKISTAVAQGQPVKTASVKASSVKAPLVKAVPAKKTASKTAATSTKASKAVVKPVAEAGKTTTQKATAKAASNVKSASKTVAKATPAPKPAAKPVASLSADEVKAPAKIKATDVKATPEKQTEVEKKA